MVLAAAKGIVMACDKSILAEFGGQALGQVTPNQNGMCQTKSIYVSKYTVQDFDKVKASFLSSVATIVHMESIPAALILNCDQTGIQLVPSSNWTLEKKGVKRVALSGGDDKRQITAVVCGSMTGDFLPLQIVYLVATKNLVYP